MKKELIDNIWVCIKDSGEKGKFRREEDADLFLGVEKATIIFEDDDEDDGQPDEAQEWYDFDPDA